MHLLVDANVTSFIPLNESALLNGFQFPIRTVEVTSVHFSIKQGSSVNASEADLNAVRIWIVILS